MTFTVSVQADIEKIKANLQLKQKAIDNATRVAINKTAEQVKTEASQQIRQERALPIRIVNRALTLRRANYNDLRATIRASGRPISLKYYNPKGPRGRRKKQNIARNAKGQFVGGTGNPPITVEVIKGVRKVVKGGFIGPNDHVYRRDGKARLPIHVRFGPSIPSAMAKRKVNTAMVRKTRDVFPRLLDHEMRRELEKVKL